MIYFIGIWFGLGAIAYPMCFGYFQNKYPSIAREYYWVDMRFALFIGFMGPCGLVVSLICSEGGRYGYKRK